MSRYAQAFYYPLINSIYAGKVITSRTILPTAANDLAGGFEELGALLATGNGVEYDSRLSQIDFSHITQQERAETVFLLFKNITSNLYPLDIMPSSVAQALLLLFNKLLPECRPSSRQAYVGSNRLIPLEYSQSIDPDIRGIIFFREFFFGKGSRKHEFGFRLQEGLASQGWDVDLLSDKEALTFVSPDNYDFAILDVDLIATPTAEQAYELLRRLKRSFKKIIVILPDPWIIHCVTAVENLSDMIDFVWGFNSESVFVNNPRFADKVITFPGASGFDAENDLVRQKMAWNTCTYNFTGSIEQFNIGRVFWAFESIKANLPIRFNITDPSQDDGLDRKESLRSYAQHLSSTNVALNFTTRMDGTQTAITGRSIEVISLERLLVQESCPAFHAYFNEGEHFLEFSEVGNLGTIIDFLDSHPGVAKTIASEGHAFYKERYSSKKLVQHFQAVLNR